MGIFDKLKNVFFEEEYVEVEEPIKKEKVTVAKKIETPEVKKERQEAFKQDANKEEPFEDEEEKEKEEQKEKSLEHDFRFMDFDDKDFEIEEKEEKPKEEVILQDDFYEEEKEEEKPKHGQESENPLIDDYHLGNGYQGLYEGSERKEKKTGFTLSPIISPVYGILDKNYKKDEIITKKEIRLSVTPKNVDLDYVREKAYGDLVNEITESIHEDVKEEEKKSEENLLYDLNDDESPAVKVVTVGDAEEYFNDLGLEYNVDYKVEREKTEPKEEKTITRRSERKKEENIEDEEVTSSEEIFEESNKEEDSNLFDLIDSMYEDKE